MVEKLNKKRLEKYIEITKKTLESAKKIKRTSDKAAQILDTAKRYYEDALFFLKKEKLVDSFACINYAQGWLDAGIKTGILKV